MHDNLKAATVKQIQEELRQIPPKQLLEIVLRLARFKKENKELLTYLLFESFDEQGYIKNVKEEMDGEFAQINRRNYYYIKKSVRKILANTKKYIRYSSKKETEVELLVYFCIKLLSLKPSIRHNTALWNLYNRQLLSIKKCIDTLHEDVQLDFEEDMKVLKGTSKNTFY